MDPWLEAPGVFPDVHDTLISLLREAINSVLPEPYLARSRTRIFVERPRPREPDVSVSSMKRTTKPKGGTATRERVSLHRMTPVHTSTMLGDYEQPYLDILTSRGERLVTSIEVLSPINKRAGSTGRKSYLVKQKRTLNAGVSLVEIDLLRGGQHTTAVLPEPLHAVVPDFDYHIAVSGAVIDPTQYPAAFRLRDRLPIVEIPLDPGTEPIAIELQPLLDRCYDSGNYRRSQLYEQMPIPALTDEQSKWAQAVLKTARS
jgi:hypothetical protein